MPVAWKLAPAPTPPLYANPKSDHARRGAFATKHLWVTPYDDNEFYPAGQYPLEPNPQGLKQWTDKACSTRGPYALLSVFAARIAPSSAWCVRSPCMCTAQNRSLVGQDLVVWHTLGVTHIPRIEDYPVMPCEYASFVLKPANFFDANPGINLPGVKDAASVELGCCGADSKGAMTKSDEVHHKQHQVQKHDCCGRAGGDGCSCAPGCECVRHKARVEAPRARL